MNVSPKCLWSFWGMCVCICAVPTCVVCVCMLCVMCHVAVHAGAHLHTCVHTCTCMFAFALSLPPLRSSDVKAGGADKTQGRYRRSESRQAARRPRSACPVPCLARGDTGVVWTRSHPGQQEHTVYLPDPQRCSCWGWLFHSQHFSLLLHYLVPENFVSYSPPHKAQRNQETIPPLGTSTTWEEKSSKDPSLR